GRVSRAALAHGIEVDYLQDIVGAQTTTEAVTRPVKVEIYAMGRFTISIDGASSLSFRRVPLRTLELLKAIVAFGGRDVAQSEIKHALWPDAEGDAAHQSLEITLRRLRQLCRDKKAVVRAGGRLSFDAERVWTDLWALGEVWGTRLSEQQLNDPVAVEQVTSRLFALYRGGFLLDEDLTWAIPVRERLRSQFARTVTLLARRLEERGTWEQALMYYDRAVAASPLVEVFYQGLM